MNFAATTLIVSAGEKSRNALSQLFKTDEFLAVTVVSGGSDARRLLIDCEFDIVVINTPLRDEFGDDLALFCAERSMGVLLLVQAEFADSVGEKVEDYGVFVLEKPLNSSVFLQSVRLLTAARKRLLGVKNQNEKLQDKIEEMRLIERAKYVLMKVLSMSEPQAHRYIEKQAMDLRVRRSEIAKNILKTYES